MKKIVSLIGMSIVSAWAQSADIAQGKETAVVCQSCHMEDGGGQENGEAESWPMIAGLPAVYLQKQMHDIADGTRIAPTMTPFVSMLSDEDIDNVSAYYASLPPIDHEINEPENHLLKLGEKLATRGDWDRYIPPCAACHGPDNQGAGDVFPSLAGQHAGYIRQQLHLWQDDKRQNDVNELMVSIAKRMTDEDIEAVSLWLAAQKPQGGQQ